jgi:hypothetical protein
MPCLINILYNTFNHTVNRNIGNIVYAVKPFSLERSGKTYFSRPDPGSFDPGSFPMTPAILFFTVRVDGVRC